MTRVLITAADLARELADARPPLVLDVRYLGPAATQTGQAGFEAGHIPGARWVDLDAELAAPAGPGGAGGRHRLPRVADFEAALRRHGVRHDAAVVVCDGGNALAASRLWWMLRDAGHENVRVLDGGVAAWRELGLPLETGPHVEVAPGDIVVRPGHLPQVDAAGVAGRTGTLWDVREPARFRGESEPIDPIAGRIPGARNLPSSQNFTDSGRLRTRSELAARFADVEAGDIVSCGSGITAAQTLLAMAYAGVEDVALYVGSWSDWISDPQRPIERG